MSLHQYIGARYVPIFYQNSLDPTSTEWEANVTYEPMTWVSLLNGSMYLSKKTVPTNAGDPASTPEYWMEAGQFNAYIQILSDEIGDLGDLDTTVQTSLVLAINEVVGNIGDLNDLNTTNKTAIVNAINEVLSNIGDLTTLKTSDQSDLVSAINTLVPLPKKYIFLGDSYNYGDAFSFPVWGELLAGILGLTATQYKSISTNGGGFVTPGANGTFWNALNTLVTSDRDSYTDIIVQGCSNDRANTITGTQIESAISSFVTSAKSAFPNATVHIGAIGWNTNTSEFPDYRKAIFAYRNAPLYGAKYIQNSEYIVHDYEHFYDVAHPDATGQERIADYLCKYLVSGGFDVHYHKVSSPTYASGFYTSLAGYEPKYVEDVYNGNSKFTVSSPYTGNIVGMSFIHPTTPQSFSGIGGVEIRPFQTFTNGLVKPDYTMTQTAVQTKSNALARISGTDHQIATTYMGGAFRLVSPLGALSNITDFIIIPDTFEYNTLYC